MTTPGSIRARGVLPVLAALAVLLYAALPRLLAAAAEQALRAHGVTVVRIAPGFPGPSGWRLHLLELTGRDGGLDFALTAREVEIGYDLAHLRAGRIPRLDLPEAALRLGPAPDAPAATGPVEPLRPDHWVEAFALDELTVERLRVEWPRADGSVGAVTLGGEARRFADRIDSRWDLVAGERARFHATLTLSTSGELKAAVSRPEAPDRPVLAIATTMVPANGGRIGLHGTLDAHLGPLEPLLAAALPPALAPLAGRVQMRWTGDRAVQTTDFNGTVTLDVSALRLGSRLRDGALHLDATVARQDTALRWRIDNSLRLAVRLDPALVALPGAAAGPPPEPAPEPLVLRAPRGLTGEWIGTPEGDRLILADRTELALSQLHTPEAQLPTLALAFPRGLHLTREAASGAWRNAGFELTLAAPTIDTRFAALGRLEELALDARVAAAMLATVPAVTIRRAHVNLLGGQARGEDIRYEPARGVNSFTIELARLDLARIVALERQQEIEASGRLDGTLPVTLAPGGLRIADGRLRAAAPGGVIRYRASEDVQSMAAANPNLNLVLQALANYHYDTLEVGVNYAENGDLALAVTMAGRNPDWNAGQPIHLNLNVDENLPTLLRSLRLAEDVSGAVEKRVRQRPPAAR